MAEVLERELKFDNDVRCDVVDVGEREILVDVATARGPRVGGL